MTLSFSSDRNKFRSRIFRKAWLFLVIVVFLLGLFFRCANLDRKIFWVDEVATATRISGFTRQEIVEQLADKGVVNTGDLQRYQELSPEKDLGDTIKALTKSPEHAPLYFLLARFWRELFGSSVTATRSLSIIFSLLAFPCLYWLCLELFKSPAVGWMAIALFSVSPFYIAYAQEARPYSLWTVTILLSNVALLRAIRLNNRNSWLFYAVTSILGFYTSLFSFLIAFGQGLYAIILGNFRYTKTVRNYAIALTLALLAFSPWLVVIAQNWQALQENTDWMREPVDFLFTASIFVATILLIFGDLPLANSLETLKIVEFLIILSVAISGFYFIFIKLRSSPKFKLILGFLAIVIFFFFVPRSISKFPSLIKSAYLEPGATIGIVTALGLLVLSTFSIYFISVKSTKPIYLFILTQTFCLPGILVLKDILIKGQTSGAPRYLLSFQLGILLAVAYLLANKIQGIDFQQQQIGKITVIMLIFLGIVSGILNLDKSPIYQKSRNFHNPPIAAILNASPNPSLFVDSRQTMDILSLSQNLEEKVKIQILSTPEKIPQMLEECEKVFLFNPSKTLRSALPVRGAQSQLTNEKSLQIEQVYKPNLLIPTETVLSLWSVKKLGDRCQAVASQTSQKTHLSH
ncbi:MAG: glycosyltransferase family 39 protein [Hydrococcus sp. Prado102]|jgi:uncharacterized membrane protein|nr:glycosyltransferase family 39 protein [Hydrococcus sp. Prado102]